MRIQIPTTPIANAKLAEYGRYAQECEKSGRAPVPFSRWLRIIEQEAGQPPQPAPLPDPSQSPAASR